MTAHFDDGKPVQPTTFVLDGARPPNRAHTAPVGAVRFAERPNRPARGVAIMAIERMTPLRVTQWENYLDGTIRVVEWSDGTISREPLDGSLAAFRGTPPHLDGGRIDGYRARLGECGACGAATETRGAPVTGNGWYGDHEFGWQHGNVVLLQARCPAHQPYATRDSVTYKWLGHEVTRTEGGR